MVKEPKIQLKVGELYEITSGILKEIVEIVSIHTDIEKINSLLNITWNSQTTACIYHTKHIAGDIIYDSDINARFHYFSDDSKLAKSAIPLTPIKKLQYEFKEKVNENNMNTLTEFVINNSTLNIITAAIALASAIAVVTPTPAPGTFLAKLYALIDFIALNIGKAKDKGN
jgi:hypothetical protein